MMLTVGNRMAVTIDWFSVNAICVNGKICTENT